MTVSSLILVGSSSTAKLRVAFFIRPIKPISLVNLTNLANLANLAIIVKAELLLVFLRLVRSVIAGFNIAILSISIISFIEIEVFLAPLIIIGVFLTFAAIKVRGPRNRELKVITG